MTCGKRGKTRARLNFRDRLLRVFHWRLKTLERSIFIIIFSRFDTKDLAQSACMYLFMALPQSPSLASRLVSHLKQCFGCCPFTYKRLCGRWPWPTPIVEVHVSPHMSPQWRRSLLTVHETMAFDVIMPREPVGEDREM